MLKYIFLLLRHVSRLESYRPTRSHRPPGQTQRNQLPREMGCQRRKTLPHVQNGSLKQSSIQRHRCRRIPLRISPQVLQRPRSHQENQWLVGQHASSAPRRWRKSLQSHPHVVQGTMASRQQRFCGRRYPKTRRRQLLHRHQDLQSSPPRSQQNC